MARTWSRARSWQGLWLLGAALVLPGFARAATISEFLGDRDFADGAAVTAAAFLAASAGEPSPFDGVFRGSDVAGPNFSASWSFDYGPMQGLRAAAISLGIFDVDSSVAGVQIASFSVDGVDLTAALNALVEGSTSPSGVVRIYTLPVPATSVLEDGSANFSLGLAAPGLGALGPTAFNGAALDFADLELEVVPEPSPLALVALGLLFMGMARRRP